MIHLKIKKQSKIYQQQLRLIRQLFDGRKERTLILDRPNMLFLFFFWSQSLKLFMLSCNLPIIIKSMFSSPVINLEESQQGGNLFIPIFDQGSLIGKPAKEMYAGSLVCFGTATRWKDYQFLAPHNQEVELKFSTQYSGKLMLESSVVNVSVPIIFAPEIDELMNHRSDMGRLRFFFDFKAAMQSSEEEVFGNMSENVRKRIQQIPVCKRMVPVRIDIYIREDIFNQNQPKYALKIKKYEENKNLIANTALSGDQIQRLQYENKQIKEDLDKEKTSRMLMIYLIKKSRVKELVPPLIAPPPRLNMLMRDYRKNTIGHKAKTKRNKERLQYKIKNWKGKFSYLQNFEPCIKGEYFVDYYCANSPQSMILWQRETKSVLRSRYLCTFKNQLGQNSNIERTFQDQAIMDENLKMILTEIGGEIFQNNQDSPLEIELSESQDEEGKQNSSGSENSKDKKLLGKLETENQYLSMHPTPPILTVELKPFQKQALTWMKYREGKIREEEIFREGYMSGEELERQLSPFWEEVQLFDGTRFFINETTGEFTNQFHPWSSVKGGILADEMGLGKTIMTLSLLADEDFIGLNLVVCPPNALTHWQNQIRNRLKFEIKTFVYHSKARQRKKVDLHNYNIVLVTYSTLGAQFKKQLNGSSEDLQEKTLFDYKFRRVILDEAHTIRSTDTLLFKGVNKLQRQYSWCLTGTLIQNSEQDLLSIFKFLNIQTLSNELWWNPYIKNSGNFESKLQIIQTCLKPIVLRRTKQSTTEYGETILELPEKHEYFIFPEFSEVQGRVYRKLKEGVKEHFIKNVKLTKNFTHVFQVISKLRAFCSHSNLIFGKELQMLDDQEIMSVLRKFVVNGAKEQYKEATIASLLESTNDCVICLNNSDNSQPVITKCGHIFCQECIIEHLKHHNTCPICRSPIQAYLKKSDLENEGLKNNDLKELQKSTKTECIFEILAEIEQRQEKCIIFTQWVGLINILEGKLQQMNKNYRSIKGSMTPKERQRSVTMFKSDPNCSVMLISMRAGATSLNLSNANNVIICDPWWNAALEDQATSRVHRIGQTKQVNIYHFFMKDSIEQKILGIQKKKRHLSSRLMMSMQRNKQNDAKQLLELLQ